MKKKRHHERLGKFMTGPASSSPPPSKRPHTVKSTNLPPPPIRAVPGRKNHAWATNGDACHHTHVSSPKALF